MKCSKCYIKRAKEEQPPNKIESEISSGKVEDAKQIEYPNIFSGEEVEHVLRFRELTI